MMEGDAMELDDLPFSDAEEEDDDRDRDGIEEMELGYVQMQQVPSMTEEHQAYLLLSRVQSLCDRYSVSEAFRHELHRLLLDRIPPTDESATALLLRRLNEGEIIYRPAMDIAIASALAEMKNQLSFQVTRHFLLFEKAVGIGRAQKALRILKVDQQGLLLQYQSLAQAWKGTHAKRLSCIEHKQVEEAIFSKHAAILGDVEEHLRVPMARLISFDAKCTLQDPSWAHNVADGLMDLAERAVFGERAAQLGDQMRMEATNYANTVKYFRDRFAHMFELSQIAPSGATDVSYYLANKLPSPKRLMTPATYTLYRALVHHVDKVKDDPRYSAIYQQSQLLLYHYCVERVKHLHAPLLREFEESRKGGVLL